MKNRVLGVLKVLKVLKVLGVLGVLGVPLCLSTLGAAGEDSAPVAAAAMRKDPAAVRALVKDGKDVNAAQGYGMTALHWARLPSNPPAGRR